MNCPECKCRSRRWGSRKIGKHEEANYRVCPKCGARWTEYRRMLLHSYKRNARIAMKPAR